MKQNKNTCVTFYRKNTLIRYFTFTLTIIVLFSSFASFCSIVYATNTSASDIPVTGQLTANASSYASAFEYFTKDAGGGYAIGNYGDADHLGCFLYKSGTTVYLYAISDTPDSHYCIMSESYNSSNDEYTYSVPTSGSEPKKYQISSSSTIHPTDYPDVTLYISQNNAYSYPQSGGILTTGTANCPTDIGNPDIDMAGIAKTIYEDWQASAVTPHPINLEIPPGYVAFVDISGLTNIRGSVTTGSGVPLTPNQWASTNVVYGYSSSIPSSFNLPLNGSTSFSWTAGRTNIFGKSQNWSWLGIFSGGSNYLFLCNPTYSNVSGVQDNGTAMILDNPSATNSYVYLYLNQAKNVKLISLNASIVYDPSNGQYGGIEDGNGDSSYTVAFDDDAGSWIITDDESQQPVGPSGIPIGGDNSIDTPSEFSTIQSWLENIANLIGSFFRGAIGAVSTLVSAGSAFINSLVSLYSWLPGPVYAVLSSALILVITIGVIKVFI